MEGETKNVNIQNNEELEKIKKKEEQDLKIFNRKFDFKKEIDTIILRTKQYKNPEILEKVAEIIPKREPNSSSRDYVKALLHWYKTEYFTWCNKPKCPKCDKNGDNIIFTEKIGTPTLQEQDHLALKTEIYKCVDCNNIEVRFPRYNSVLKLMETKTGRCSEWSNLFGAILSAGGFLSRIVNNFEDHVWNEFYCPEEQKWIHLDSCEDTLDNPLLYEQGWGRVMTFIIAGNAEGFTEVTPRYIKDWSVLKKRRNPETKRTLRELLNEYNQKLRAKMTSNECMVIEDRFKKEIVELNKLKYKDDSNPQNSNNVKETEKLPRQSGDEEWRKKRGE